MWVLACRRAACHGASWRARGGGAPWQDPESRSVRIAALLGDHRERIDPDEDAELLDLGLQPLDVLVEVIATADELGRHLPCVLAYPFSRR